MPQLFLAGEPLPGMSFDLYKGVSVVLGKEVFQIFMYKLPVVSL